MGTLTALAAHHVHVKPFHLNSLVQLKIIRKFNDHARLWLTGIIPEEQKDDYIGSTEAQTPIEVTQTDYIGSNTTIFKGFAQNIDVRSVHGVYYLEVEAVSASILLDVQSKSRSFQNTAMTYTDLIKQVIADYPGANMMDNASQGATLQKFTLQLLETDWAFLKRMASRFNAGLIPEPTFAQPKFYFGRPENGPRGSLDNLNYRVRKDLAGYRLAAENFGQQLREEDFIYYEVETEALLNVGDSIKFQEINLFVKEAETQVKGSALRHIYRLTPAQGLNQNPIYNPAIAGASVEGTVIDVAKDKVRVHLAIDQEQKKEEAFWFPYSSVYTAEGNSGWYCPPELGDHVRVYFSGHKEEEGVALSAVRKDTADGKTNKVGNPDIKYFRTKSGKELMFSPEEIVITAKDGEVYIRLNEQNGIEIFSKKEIKFISEEDLSIEADKRVMVQAKEAIDMSCKGSILKLDGKASIKGTQIKSN